MSRREPVEGARPPRVAIGAAALVALLGLVASGCGDDAGDDDGTDGVASEATDGSGDESEGLASEATDDVAEADLPAECREAAPADIEVVIDSIADYADGSFTPLSAVGVATPIVPNGDGSLDDVDFAGFEELGAETDLLLYTQWIGDHAFTSDDIGFLGGPEPPAGSITLGLTVVPPTEPGLSVGDTVSSTDEIQYDAITTFGTAGVFFLPAEGIDTFFLVDNLDEDQGGTVEVLHVDDDWLCARWDLAGETSQPQGTYSVRGVVVTPLDRATTPFS